jgi:hypothetical protein
MTNAKSRSVKYPRYEPTRGEVRMALDESIEVFKAAIGNGWHRVYLDPLRTALVLQHLEAMRESVERAASREVSRDFPNVPASTIPPD